jgi:multiple sugar transport system substrate-binding protein
MEPTAPDSLYRQLMNRLRADILAGRYGSDGRLPTEFELCEIYGLSRTPVARALHDLAAAGVVTRHRRRGTFVNPAWLAAHNSAQPALRLLGPGPTWADQIRELAGPDLPLDIESPGMGELHDLFRRQIAEGRGPDLVVVDSVWVAEFARAHFLTPLSKLDTGWLADALDTDFLPPFATAYRHDGDTVAVHAPADVTGLWYAREALASVSATAPGTWAELRELGTALMGAWERPLVLPGGLVGGETTTYALVALLAANGASVLSTGTGPQDGGAVTLDSPAAVEAMAFLRQLVDDGVLSTEVAGYASHQGVQLFAEGHAAMCVGASYQIEDIAGWSGLTLDTVLDRFGFVPLPHGPGAQLLAGRGSPGAVLAGPPGAVLAGGMAYAIPRQAAHPELAMSLLRTLTSADVLVRQCLRTGQLPPRRTALDAVSAVSPFHAATGQMLEHAILRPVTPAYALLSDQLQAMTYDVITRRTRPSAAVSHAAETISAVTRLPWA